MIVDDQINAKVIEDPVIVSNRLIHIEINEDIVKSEDSPKDLIASFLSSDLVFL